MSDPAAHARRARPNGRPAWSWLLPVGMVVTAMIIPALVWYAADAILNSRDGNTTSSVTDPTLPGYEVLVLPSPSHMVLNLDPDGGLASVVIMSVASNDLGGTGLFIPAETLVEGGERRLTDVYAAEGEDSTRRAVADLMDVNVDKDSVLDAAAWTQITAPASPISVDNATDVVDPATGSVLFNAGNIGIEADQAALFMGLVNPGEGTQGRVQRQVAFWNAWIATIAASDDPTLIPGELSSGFPRMLRGLANGPAVLTSVGGADLELADGTTGTQINVPELRSLVNGMIPFPVPVEPGARPRVRLLDGVGGIDVATVHSGGLVAAGAQIAIIGNAANFDVAETVVVFHDERWEAKARAFGEVLGGALVQFDPVEDAVLDVTIIIGQDQEPALG